MISLVSINQSGHNIYQKKAEDVSYRRVSNIFILVKGLDKYVLKNTKIPIFSCHFFNYDSSFNIKDRKLRFSVFVLCILVEGTVSQIFYLCLSFCFMSLRK